MKTKTITITTTNYQTKVIKAYLNRKSYQRFIIQTGAKRSGKTFSNIAIIMTEIERINNELKEEVNKTGMEKTTNYIMAGPTLKSIQTNIISELNNMFGTSYTISNQKTTFMIGRVNVACFSISTADAWKKIRGHNSSGAFINEATAAHQSAIEEIQDRVSEHNGLILMDMNPSSEYEWIYKRFISKEGHEKYNIDELTGESQVLIFHSTIFDNEQNLGSNMNSIISSNLPEDSIGYQRNILGKWCNNEDVVMTNYNKILNAISYNYKTAQPDEIFAGFDQGFRHFGVLHIIGYNKKRDEYYQIKEIAETQLTEVDWVAILKEQKALFGFKVVYCDSAAQSYIQAFRNAGIDAVNARKELKEGTTFINNLFRDKKLFINVDESDLLQENLSLYSYKKGSSDVIDGSKDDDSIDSLRYGVYTHHYNKNIKKPKKTVRPVNFGSMRL